LFNDKNSIFKVFMKGIVLKKKKTNLSQILQMEQIMSLDKIILITIFQSIIAKKIRSICSICERLKSKKYEKINY